MSFHLEAKLLSYCCSSTQYLWSKASFSFCVMVNFSFGPPDNYCLILSLHCFLNWGRTRFCKGGIPVGLTYAVSFHGYSAVYACLIVQKTCSGLILWYNKPGRIL